jgi:uncharacterized membrane protein
VVAAAAIPEPQQSQPVRPQPVRPEPAPAEPEPDLDWRRDLRQAAPAVAPRARAARPATEGSVSLFATYAMILLAVPTFGVSAVVGLLSILGRSAPSGDVALSHHIFQKRTLIAAGGTAALGVVLIIVGIGVFVLFALAVWMLVRGAVGVLKLKADKPMPNPRSWFI